MAANEANINMQNIQTKTSLIIFLKGSVAPVILYFEDPKSIYDNIKEVITSSKTPKMIELEAIGPLKKISLLTSEITGLALQEEQYVVKS